MQKELQKKGIGIEMCPISNLQHQGSGKYKELSDAGIPECRIKGNSKYR